MKRAEQLLDDRLALSLRETGELLGISGRTVRRMAHNKEIASVMISRRLFIPKWQVLKLAGEKQQI